MARNEIQHVQKSILKKFIIYLFLDLIVVLNKNMPKILARCLYITVIKANENLTRQFSLYLQSIYISKYHFLILTNSLPRGVYAPHSEFSVQVNYGHLNINAFDRIRTTRRDRQFF